MLYPLYLFLLYACARLLAVSRGLSLYSLTLLTVGMVTLALLWLTLGFNQWHWVPLRELLPLLVQWLVFSSLTAAGAYAGFRIARA